MIQSRLRLLGRIALGALVLVLATTSTSAQTAPAANTSGPGYDSRWDFAALYSYLGVHGADKVSFLGTGTNPITNYSYSSVNEGLYVSGAYYFNKSWGIEGAFAAHDMGRGHNADFNSINAGLIYRLRNDHVTYFAHALIGGVDMNGPNLNNTTTNYENPYHWGTNLTLGGGADYQLPKFKSISIRVFQADYVFNHTNFGAPGVPTTTGGLTVTNPLGGRANLYNAQLSTGVVFHFGSIAPPPPVTLSCSATPTSVYPGDPVTVTGTAGALAPKASPTYTWSSTSGAVMGSGPTVTVSTKTPGSYTVSGKVSEGDKAGQSASCTTSFTVKAYDPPTISCMANPSTVNPGESSTITSTGSQRQNLALTYSYSTTAGSVSGNGTTATLSTAGAPSGTATVTCNVVAADGQTASNSTTVSILAPPPPPQPMSKSLCSVNFERDKARPTRVDNEAKACLDDITLSLQQDPGAKLAIVGNQTAKEAKLKSTRKDAAERAANTKEYLVKDKGIDGSRIMLFTGSEDSKSVSTTLVPTGATLNTAGLTPVDEAKVKAKVRKPIK